MKDKQKGDGSLLVELEKAWYGTAAASALWHEEITGTLIDKCGYTRHPLVSCLFYKDLPDGKRGHIMLHVGDLCVMVPEDGVEKRKLKDILTKCYGEMRIQDNDAFTYVGVDCEWSEDRNCLKLGMSKRILKLCDKFN